MEGGHYSAALLEYNYDSVGCPFSMRLLLRLILSSILEQLASTSDCLAEDVVPWNAGRFMIVKRQRANESVEVTWSKQGPV
jgi:hypothetical protein